LRFWPMYDYTGTVGYRWFFRHFKTGWPSTDVYQYFTLIFLSIWSFPKILIYSKTLSVIRRPAFPSVGLCKNMSKQTNILTNVYNCWCISLGQPLIFGMSMFFLKNQASATDNTVVVFITDCQCLGLGIERW
jgi:hypothetical protein